MMNSKCSQLLVLKTPVIYQALPLVIAPSVDMETVANWEKIFSYFKFSVIVAILIWCWSHSWVQSRKRHFQNANCVKYVLKQGKCCAVNKIITPSRQGSLTPCYHLHLTACDNTELNHCCGCTKQGKVIFNDKLIMYTTTGPLNLRNESIITFFFAEIA